MNVRTKFFQVRLWIIGIAIIMLISGGFKTANAKNDSGSHGITENSRFENRSENRPENRLENRPVTEHAQANLPGKVESVEIQLNMAGEIYEGLQERIEYSIGRVGEKILLTQPLSLLMANQEAVKTAIFNVFSKVLIGFTIEKVELALGSHTKVLIYLKTAPPFIERVNINLAIDGMTPELDMFREEIATKIETELNHIFTGLPVESISWAEGIFNLAAKYLLERELPGYNSQFSLKPGPITVFDIRLVPREPVVTEVKTDIRAVNIPVFFVKFKTNGYRDQFNGLKGLPVEFLSHYRLRIQEYLTQNAQDFSQIKQSGMQVKLDINPGVKTRVVLTVDSTTVLTNFDAGYWVGQNESSVNLQTYFGYRTDSYELFTRGYFFGEQPGGNLFAGCYFPLSQNFTGGFEYGFEHAFKRLGFHFQFEHGDYLDLRFGLDADSPTEGVIGIYLNERFHLELIDRNNNFAVQLKYHF